MSEWVSKNPDQCDVCKAPILEYFVDGATRMGPWAIMCKRCHGIHGRGLGLGLGQAYELGMKAVFRKVEG